MCFLSVLCFSRSWERDSIVFMEKAIYGAFKNVPGEGKVGVGRAMHLDPNTTIQFSPTSLSPTR